MEGARDHGNHELLPLHGSGWGRPAVEGPRKPIQFRPCLDAVKAKRKFFVNHLYGVLNVVKK